MAGYDFYVCTYQGDAITEQEWPSYSRRAEAKLAKYKRDFTVTVPDDEPEAESLAICAMAEALHNVDVVVNGEAGGQSASIGSVSTSFGSAGATAVDVTPKGLNRALYEAAQTYLEIYRGVG